MDLATKQNENPNENIEKTSLIDSIINITDNPNHHTLDSMSKHLVNNFVLPNHEDNFAKYLSNFNYNSMEFNSDNFDLAQNNSKNTLYKMNDLFSKSNEHLKSLSKNNSFAMNNQKSSNMKTVESLVVKDQEDDILKNLYEDNQKKIEKALIRKNLNNKDNSLHKKPKTDRSLTSNLDKNFSKTSTLISKHTGSTNMSNKDIKDNKKTYKEYSDSIKNFSKTSKTHHFSQKDLKINNSSHKANEKKKIIHLYDKSANGENNLSPERKVNENTFISNTFNKKNKVTENTNILDRKNVNDKSCHNSVISSVKIINHIGEMSNHAPLLLSYSKKNPLQEPITSKDQDLFKVKEQLKLLDSKLNSNLAELSKIGKVIIEKDGNSVENNNKGSFYNNQKYLTIENKQANTNIKQKEISEIKTDLNKESDHIVTIKNRYSPDGEKDKDYDITEIYKKRKILLDKKGSRKQSYYHKNVEWKKKIKERNDLLKKIQDEYDIKKCSFSPKISMSSKTISERKNDKESKTFYEKNIAWKLDIERNKQEGFIEREKKEYEECSFKPNIIKRSLSIQDINQKKKSKNNDYYQKNVEWLKKNKELKTNLELKIEEKKTDSFKKHTYNKVNSCREIKQKIINDQGVSTFSESVHNIRSISKEMESLKLLVSGLKETLDQSKLMNKILEDKAIN